MLDGLRERNPLAIGRLKTETPSCRISDDKHQNYNLAYIKKRYVDMDILLLIARLMMASLFLVGGIPKLRGDPGARQAIAGLGLPAPAFLERMTGLGLVAGAALLAFGVWTRPAAALLAAFVVVVSPLLLRFWVVEDVQQRARLTQAFAGNIGVVGGLLAFVAIGPGSMALLPAT